MPGRMSNKDRIAKAAAEVDAGKKAKAKKKAKKKVAKKPSARKKAAAKSAGRLKLVWVVCDHSLRTRVGRLDSIRGCRNGGDRDTDLGYWHGVPGHCGDRSVA